MGKRLHIWLLNYLPLVGYIVYGIGVGFDDNIFTYLIYGGGITLVVYQTVLASIYQPPRSYFMAISGMLLPIIVLSIYTFAQGEDFWPIVFLEFTAIDLTAMLIMLMFSFVMKAIREKGIDGGFAFPVIFSFLLFGGFVAVFVAIFLQLFARTDFDIVNICVISFAVLRSALYFYRGIAPLADLPGGTDGDRGTDASDDDVAFKILLPSLGLWYIAGPFLVWLVRFIIY